uniref:AAA+ ATPase At3g28540-like C-terminal domain-containing protein n=1 Tax=Arundo donax TaxID=35708 RepID=A0A0A9ADJ9_ARUDO
MFPEIQDLLAEVEATAAEVSEMLLLSEDAGVALLGVAKFLIEKKKKKQASGDGN